MAYYAESVPAGADLQNHVLALDAAHDFSQQLEKKLGAPGISVQG